MSTLDQLLALGAQSVGGVLVWKGKALGHFRSGQFFPTDEGLSAAQITDVVAREVPPQPEARTRGRGKPKEKVPAPASAIPQAPEPDAEPSLDDLDLDE